MLRWWKRSFQCSMKKMIDVMCPGNLEHHGTIWAQAELWGIEPTQPLNGMTKAQTTQSNQWGPSEHHDSKALGCLKTVPSSNATYALRDDLPDLPIKKWWFSRATWNEQRVNPYKTHQLNPNCLMVKTTLSRHPFTVIYSILFPRNP